MTTWSIKVAEHPEIYLVVAESKKDAVSYLETYLAEDLTISNVSEMDDGTIIALDALDAQEDDEDEDEEEEGWKNGDPPLLYGEAAVSIEEDDEEDEDDDDEDDEDDEEDDDDWDEDDDYFDLDDDDEEDEEDEED